MTFLDVEEKRIKPSLCQEFCEVNPRNSSIIVCKAKKGPEWKYFVMNSCTIIFTHVILFSKYLIQKYVF